MIKTATTVLFGCLLLILTRTDTKIEAGVMTSDLSKDVEMVTDYGTIIVRLSDDTPKHRNNFIKLVNEKFFDSIQFHRIIEGFIIQTGNHKTKAAYPQMKQLQTPLHNLIESEIRPQLFHKRGSLNAARMGGIFNPSCASSGSQFTIVQGTIQTDSTLDVNLKRLNKVRAENIVMNKPEYKKDLDAFVVLWKKINAINVYDTELSKDEETTLETTFTELKTKLEAYNFDSLADIELQTMKPYSYPEAHRAIYKTSGGAPNLDQNYTVFGEVVKGMEVVDSIAAVATNTRNKPLTDVYILTARMITRKAYN